MTPEEKARKDEADVRAAGEVLDRAARGLGRFRLSACINCGLCAETCHVYLSDPRPENMPGLKAAAVSALFRGRTVIGRMFPWLVEAKKLTPETIDALVDGVYGRCTSCARCSAFCPLGIDLHEVINVGRRIAANTDRVPTDLAKTVKAQTETGNQMEIPVDEFVSTMEWLSEDLQDELEDDKISIPVDKKGARFLYIVNPREVKFFPLSLMSAAGVFHAAGDRWTLSSKAFDVTNYGFYAGDEKSAGELVRRILAAAEELGVEEIILSECGHGFRSNMWEGPGWLGKEYPLPVRSVLLLLEEYLDQGRLKADPAKIKGKVTLHDPCNLVRKGGVVEPQRRILRKITNDFTEMTPNREDNFCCGGGGGLLALSEWGDLRVKSGSVKADQIRATGAKIVATPCHNCCDQLIEINKKYKLGVEIKNVIELVYDALVWEGKPTAAGGDKEKEEKSQA